MKLINLKENYISEHQNLKNSIFDWPELIENLNFNINYTAMNNLNLLAIISLITLASAFTKHEKQKANVVISINEKKRF